jgi:uncharacterized protein YdaU (DUF1376 family)
MARKSPAFQFYASDFVSDGLVARMSDAEVGMYIRLLCYAWTEGGLPLEIEEMAEYVKSSLSDFQKAWQRRLNQCFEIRDGKYVQPRQEKVRGDLLRFRERQSAAGKKSAEARASLVKSQPRLKRGSRSVKTKEEPTGSESGSDLVATETQLSVSISNITETTSPRSKGKLDALIAPPRPVTLPVDFPTTLGGVKPIAVLFLAAFANCTTPEAQKKHGPAYLGALAIFRSRGATIAETWTAFSDAWLAQDGKPLFGSQAKNAVSYLQRAGSRADSKPEDIPDAQRGVAAAMERRQAAGR